MRGIRIRMRDDGNETVEGERRVEEAQIQSKGVVEMKK